MYPEARTGSPKLQQGCKTGWQGKARQATSKILLISSKGLCQNLKFHTQRECLAAINTV